MDMDDDDFFLYGEPKAGAAVAEKPDVSLSVPQPVSVEKAQDVAESLEASIPGVTGGTPEVEPEVQVPPKEEVQQQDEEPELQVEMGDEEEEVEEEEGEEEEDSESDIEIIMEPAVRSLDLRQQRPGQQRSTNNASFGTPKSAPPLQPQPSLTTEYTPRERGGVTKLPTAPQLPSTPTPSTAHAHPASDSRPQPDGLNANSNAPADSGPDPSTLPPATAPPSHPKIDPTIPGTLEGRSVLEVDLNALAEKPWRRPGSDLSDWFNYGFDEMTWESYCYRRRDIGEVAAILKANILSFAGVPEEQLAALPPEIRTMVLAGATAMMQGGPGAGGMIPPGAGMNMNGNAMMNPMMGMNPMMNPMMHDMGVVGMNGEMGPMGPGMPMGPTGGPGQGMGGGMMPDGPPANMGGGLSGGVGMSTVQGPQGNVQGPPEPGQMGGDGFVGGQGQGMMGMGMGGGDYGMPVQEPNMSQQMYPGMESNNAPVPTPNPPRVPSGGGMSYRGRGMQMQGQMGGLRGRGNPYPGRGRPLPIRPSSPLPPNVPTGPRNKNKYKDIDGSAPAVDGLDYGGGGKEVSRHTPDDDRSARKRRGSPGMDDPRGSKRR